MGASALRQEGKTDRVVSIFVFCQGIRWIPNIWGIYISTQMRHLNKKGKMTERLRLGREKIRQIDQMGQKKKNKISERNIA